MWSNVYANYIELPITNICMLQNNMLCIINTFNFICQLKNKKRSNN